MSFSPTETDQLSFCTNNSLFAKFDKISSKKRLCQWPNLLYNLSSWDRRYLMILGVTWSSEIWQRLLNLKHFEVEQLWKTSLLEILANDTCKMGGSPNSSHFRIGIRERRSLTHYGVARWQTQVFFPSSCMTSPSVGYKFNGPTD